MNTVIYCRLFSPVRQPFFSSIFKKFLEPVRLLNMGALASVFSPAEAKSRRNPLCIAGLSSEQRRKISRQGVCGEMLNRF